VAGAGAGLTTTQVPRSAAAPRYEGLRPSEAAVVCGVSSEAPQQRLSRARVMLAERLRETPVTGTLKEGYMQHDR
jgi:hypothetical protein